MQTSVDKFGRVLVPKTIRDHLGLHPGTHLLIEEHEHEILIRLINEEQPIEKRQGVLVFTGKVTSNIERAVDVAREERNRKLGF